MTVDFKTFAAAGGANVISQAVYDAAVTLRDSGFLSGTAPSLQVNKVWRQSSIMSAVVAQFINNLTAQDVLDDGTTTTILSNLMAAIMKAGYAVDSGVVDAYAVTLSPAPLAYYPGMVVGFKTANASTLVNPTLNVNGLGAVGIREPGGTTLLAGQIPANTVVWVVYNSTGPRFELLNLSQVGITPTGGDSSTRFATTAFLAGASVLYAASAGTAGSATTAGTANAVVNAIISSAKLINVVAGDYLLFKVPASVTFNQVFTTPTKRLEWAVRRAGAYRLYLKYQHTYANFPGSNHIAVYRNGALVSEFSTVAIAAGDGAYYMSLDTSGWAPGDLMQIYSWGDNANCVYQTEQIGGVLLCEGAPVTDLPLYHWIYSPGAW
jgi:hypothetical protein